MKFRNLEMADQRARVDQSVRDLLSGVEDLLRSTASHTGEEIAGARSRLRSQLERVRSNAHDWEDIARDRTRRAAASADHYVHENAWKTIGIVAIVGILVGCLSAASISRR